MKEITKDLSTDRQDLTNDKNSDKDIVSIERKIIIECLKLLEGIKRKLQETIR